MKKITLFLLLVNFSFCYNKSKPDIQGTYILKDSTYSEKLTFESDTTLIHDFLSDSGTISTNCDYVVKHDSILVVSSQIQNHVNYFTISDTFLMIDKNVIVLSSTRDIFRKAAGLNR